MNSQRREWLVLALAVGVVAAYLSSRIDLRNSMTGRYAPQASASGQPDVATTIGISNLPSRFPERPAYLATARLDLTGPTHPISEGIFGVCTLPEDQLRRYRIGVMRYGGNTTSRYNWKINADNGAADWYFRNRGEPIANVTDNVYLQHARMAQRAGASAYITIPMLGWVAKDNQSYSFPVRKYGPQKKNEPGHDDVGNGVRPDGTLIPADPNDTSIAVGPDFVQEAVALAVRHKGGVKYWALDNEPMLWQETHRDVHPRLLGYDELWDRTVRYAEAIKTADPSAKVAGFCSWGWTDLYYSAKDEGGDRYATRPDHLAHGSEPLAEWFIRKCGEYKKKHGRALVDVFDFHWYPQAQVNGKTPFNGKGMDLALNELRLRSTRDLWDPNYQQESWIHRASGGQSTRVIRRVREWIDRHNPGMELSIGEYNFGGSDNITGALAQADAFGILASERVDLAFIWTTPEGTQHLAWELFRNYDGQGGRFGETLVPVSTDNKDLAIYAATRRDGAMTIIAINKNLGGACDLSMSAAGLKGDLRVWRFEQSNLSVFECAVHAMPMDGHVALRIPAASASILVVK